MASTLALVTGASSGIGEALARRLARAQYDLVLVARRADRLEALARELSGVRTHVIPTDLIAPGGAAGLVAEIERRGLEIEWLVNNAGFGTAGRFDRLPVARELDEIRLNVRVPVELTRRFLPAMLRRGHGGVMNVASVAAYGPMAYSATYAATKAFVLSFSESLVAELRGTGVRVVCVCPGFTRTGFQETAGIDVSHLPGFVWMSAEAVADQAVQTMTGGSGVLVNGMLNKLNVVAIRLAPRGLIARATAAAMKSRMPDR